VQRTEKAAVTQESNVENNNSDDPYVQSLLQENVDDQMKSSRLFEESFAQSANSKQTKILL